MTAQLNQPNAPLILTNGNILTLDQERPQARQISILGERIAELDGSQTHRSDATVVDLEGATVLPGLTDAHLHLGHIGRRATWIDLSACPDLASLQEAVRIAGHGKAPGSWILGSGWDQSRWPEQRLPAATDLDRVAPDHCVWLERIDGHAGVANTCTLRAAAPIGDVEGGTVMRHPDGEATGTLIDKAMEVIRRVIPPPAYTEIDAQLQRAAEQCLAAGLTTVHDMAVTPQVLARLRHLTRTGKLSLQVAAYLYGPLETLMPILQEPQNDGWVRVLGVKFFADGALGSWGAALTAPYSDRPEATGLLTYDPEALKEDVRRVHRAGAQAAIHAIGDRGIDVALDAIAAGQGEDRDRRHRIEHAQVLRPDQAARCRALGVVASMQPSHLLGDARWLAHRLGRERLEGVLAYRWLLDNGVPMAFGSDAPVEPMNPWRGMTAAISRRPADEPSAPVIGPDHCLSLSQALSGWTSGACYAAHGFGTEALRPGAPANLTIVEGNPFEIPVEQLATLRTKMVVVNGRMQPAP